MKNEKTITKEEIERFFGTVQSYVEYLYMKIEQCNREIRMLKAAKPYEIFTEDIRELAINNTRFSECLTLAQKAMVDVFQTQLEEHEFNIIVAKTFL